MVSPVQVAPIDPIAARVREMVERIEMGQEEDWYYYLQPVAEMDGPRVVVEGKTMLMFASYSYLGLLRHPKIDAAAMNAIAHFGTGTHGVRILAGTTTLHQELETALAEFKGTDDAIAYSSGYVTNLATISDKLNHASIVDGCLLSRAEFVRFRHNDMEDLAHQLAKAPRHAGKLVVVDAVFSMDGDIVDLPHVVELCHRYNAKLMVDEAHSLGVLGRHGRGIEEHYGMEGCVDLKMGTLSKTIPAIGGYVAGDRETIMFLKHTARAFVFSAALPPPVCAAAIAALEVIQEEPERRHALQRNVEHFIGGLKARGFDTARSQTPIVPIIVGSDERAYQMTSLMQKSGIFVMPVVSPAVPPNTARLRANVTAAHSEADIDYALDAFERAGQILGVI